MANFIKFFLILLLIQVSVAGAETGRGGQVLFDTAEEALASLKAALKAEDAERLIQLYGKKSKDIFSTGDPVGDKALFRQLSMRFDQRAELLAVYSEEYSKEQWYLIRFGKEGWDMHTPLVNRGKGWEFATEYASDADLRVRESLNEVATVDTLRALVKAQKDFKGRDTNDDGVFEYSSRFISTPDKQDGLYWQPRNGDDLSPIDGLIARALKDGYPDKATDTPTYCGYIYKMIYQQGGKTRGGKKNYLKNDKLTEGFSILAYPVKYNASGKGTFMVNADGQVYKRDFGSRTESIASEIKSMDLDTNWVRVDPVLGGKNSRTNWK